MATASTGKPELAGRRGSKATYGGGRQNVSIFGGYGDDDEFTPKKSPFAGRTVVNVEALPAAGVASKYDDGSYERKARPGQVALQQNLTGNDIFGTQNAPAPPLSSPERRARAISDAKKASLYQSSIFTDAPAAATPKTAAKISNGKLHEMSGSDIFGTPKEDVRRSSLKCHKPPGGDSSIVFGDPAEHISLKYRTSNEPVKIIG